MTQFIKNGKIYNTPIKIEVNKKLIISTSVEELKRYGYEVYVPKKREKSLEELIEESNNFINDLTDEKILNNFTWRENEFYLTIENQTNFANMFIAREYLTFPQTIKTKTGYFTLENKNDVEEFYLAGVNYIKKCLEEGWQEKTNAENEIRKNYK